MGSIVGSIAGGLIGASGSKSAAKTQAAAADRATEAQREMFERQVELQEPFRQAGLSANNRLMYLLGLNPSAAGATGAMTYEQARNKLLPQYTKSVTTGGMSAPWQDPSHVDYANALVGGWSAPQTSTTTETIDSQGLEAAIRQMMAENPGQQFDTSDPAFGSLMRRFSMSDFEADPGYQFRMDEGMRGVEGGAAARGGLLSGAALKAIQKYGQGLASQEYGNAYGRYNADQTNQYNKLAGLVNSGQRSVNQLTNAAGQFGQSQANNIIGAGNAQASGIMGSTNAIVGGINSGINNWQQDRWMQEMEDRNLQNQNNLMRLMRNPSVNGWGSSYGNPDLTRL